MKNYITIILVVIGIIIVSLLRVFYDNKIEQEKLIIKDTVYVNVTDSSLVTQLDSLCNVIDSLKLENDFMFEELSVAIFKLERIREYNEVAKKGNNIIFLRGWINRVLDE